MATIVITKLSDFTRDNIIQRCVNVEAGYVNNPNDTGGETNCGITAATAAEHKADLVAKFGWNGKMINLTPEMAMWIFRVSWWDRLACDQLLEIHPFIADRVFDFGVNAGRVRAATALQVILNALNRQAKDYPDVAEDGKLSATGESVRALRAFYAKRGNRGLLNFTQYLIGEQSHHYVEISRTRQANEEFTNGWGERVTNATNLYHNLIGQL